jgi:hypothetical protein
VVTAGVICTNNSSCCAVVLALMAFQLLCQCLLVRVVAACAVRQYLVADQPLHAHKIGDVAGPMYFRFVLKQLCMRIISFSWCWLQ